MRADETDDGAVARELLALDYEHFAQSFWNNEQLGETRVNWFLTIVTAAIGGLITLATGTSAIGDVGLRFLVGACLFALLVFGGLTLLRMLKRKEVSRGYQTRLAEIRAAYVDGFDPEGRLVDYLKPLEPSGKIGGLTHLVAGVDCLLISGIFGTIAYPARQPSGAEAGGSDFAWLCLVSVSAFVLSAVAMWLAIRRRKSPSQTGPADPTP